MKYGYVKVALCTPPLKVGACLYNLNEIKKCVKTASENKAEVVVFGELSLTGSTLGSMKNYNQLLSACEDAILDLTVFSKSYQQCIIVGFPLSLGGKTVSAAALIQGGALNHIALKNCAEFCGEIMFCGKMQSVSSNAVFKSEALNATFGISFGEAFDELNSTCDTLVKNGADVIINLASGKALINSFEKRVNKINVNAERLICAYLYVSTGSGESVAQNVYCGDRIVSEMGSSVLALEGDNPNYTVFAEIDAELIKNQKQFKSAEFSISSNIQTIAIPNLNCDVTREINRLPFVPSSNEFDRIINIMGRGIYCRMQEAKADKIIIGFSGGLDSTNVLVAVARMFKKYKLDLKNIIAVTMPGTASSERTINNSLKLVKALKVTHIHIPISEAVTQHLKAIGHNSVQDVVYENAQARERTQILLDLGNKMNALMLGTGDLSETALGFSTYGGDQLAQYNPNSSLTKTLIRAMMRNYCLTTSNAEAAKVVNDVLDTPISPELIPNQQTEDFLGPYELHDFFLYNLIGNGFSVEKVVYLSRLVFNTTPKKTILKYLRVFIVRFFSNQFKRRAECDGIQVTEFDLSDKTIFSEYDPELFLAELDKLEK